MKTTNTIKRLAEIAEIRSGFTFRGKIEEVAEGNAYILQIKDLRKQQSESGTTLVNHSLLPQVIWEGRAKALVGPGTVLLPSRGGYFRAAYTKDEATDRPVIASSQFIIIRPRSTVILPGFLCWSLNRPSMQHYLEEIASQGTSIAMLSTAAAKELKLEVPSLETQQKILHLNQLWEQEQQLTHALLKNRETMLQGMFQQLLKEKNT